MYKIDFSKPIHIHFIGIGGISTVSYTHLIACGRNIPEKIAEIVKGVAEGCVQADCALVGGETAEHPSWDVASALAALMKIFCANI